MRIHRFFIKTSIQALVKDGGNNIAIFDADLVHQWKDVFRYTAGSRMAVFDSSGEEYLVMIQKVWGSSVDLEILEKKTGKNLVKDGTVHPGHSGQKQGLQIWLFCSILKNDNFDLVVQKATELGVSVIVPTVCERTIKKKVNMSRLEKIIIEAVEQSGRTLVPRILPEMSVKNGLEQFEAEQGGHIIVCQQGEDGKAAKGLGKENLSDDLRQGDHEHISPLGLCIGPEGGWSPAESAYFEEKKYRKMSLGSHVLRAETAAIVSVAMLTTNPITL